MTARLLASVAALGGAAVLATGCSIEIDTSGKTVTETIQVGDFERVSIDTSWDADIEVGPETSVEVEVDDNVLDDVDIRVDGDTLVVDLDSGLFSINGDLAVHITTPTLIGVEIDGASKLDIENLEADRFEIDLNGASQVTGEGAVGELIIDADGASQLDFDDVVVEVAEVDANGASRIDLAGADEVRGRLDGASRLDVSDTADVRVSTSGASSVS